MVRISANDVPKIIQAVGHRIGFVLFTKRDGTKRKMWFHSLIPARMRNGTGPIYDATAKRISLVRDIMLDAVDPVRAVRWDAVDYLTVDNTKYKVTNKEK